MIKSNRFSFDIHIKNSGVSFSCLRQNPISFVFIYYISFHEHSTIMDSVNALEHGVVIL